MLTSIFHGCRMQLKTLRQSWAQPYRMLMKWMKMNSLLMSHEYQAFKPMQADLSISPFLWVVSKLTHLNGVNIRYVYLVLWYFTP